MTTQTPDLQLTVVRNPEGKFDHWEMAVDSVKCAPATCTVPVKHGDNANFTATITDPQGQVTFSSNPLLVPPTPKAEIHTVTGQNSTTLHFQDHNWDAETLKYVLNFNNAPWIDPIIQNGGGGPPGYTSQTYLPTSGIQFATEIVAALVIGGIVALFLRRLFS